MKMAYCQNCGKNTGHKRALGFGTLFAVILTGGLWLLAIPGYPERCIICGSSKEEETSEKETSNEQAYISSLSETPIWLFFVIIGACIVVFLLYNSLR